MELWSPVMRNADGSAPGRRNSRPVCRKSRERITYSCARGQVMPARVAGSSQSRRQFASMIVRVNHSARQSRRGTRPLSTLSWTSGSASPLADRTRGGHERGRPRECPIRKPRISCLDPRPRSGPPRPSARSDIDELLLARSNPDWCRDALSSLHLRAGPSAPRPRLTCEDGAAYAEASSSKSLCVVAYHHIPQRQLASARSAMVVHPALAPQTLPASK
jgi:hypothetical protein